MRVLRFAVTIAVAALVFAVPSAASALSWTQGGTTPFSGTQTGLQPLSSGGKSYLALPMKSNGPSIIGSGVLATSIDPLADGGVLLTDSSQRRVVRLNASGAETWSFSAIEDPTLFEPYFASYTNKKTTLIVDRWSNQVIEVDENKNVVWRYSSLYKPYSAQMTDAGTVLIADAGNFRVIEVKKVGAADGDIVWQYGVNGNDGAKDGSKDKYLRFPTSAQRFADGDTLITDKNLHRVIRVSKKKSIEWSYGTKGVSGNTLTQLRFPSSAYRLADNSIAIADTKNLRVLRITSRGTQELAEFLEPLTARLDSKGNLIVADPDPGAGAPKLYGYSTKTGIYKTGAVSLNSPGYRKWVSKISVAADVPKGTSATLYYAFDGAKKYTKAKGLSVTFSGKGRKCTYLHVQVRLNSADGATTSVLKTVTVKYQLVPLSGTGTGTTGYGTSPGTGTGIPGTGGTLSGSLLGSQATTTSVTKSGGAVTMLPSGTAVELQGVNVVHSGYVMDSVSSEMPGAGASVNQPALTVDSTSAIAAALLLGTFYTLGFAGPQLSHAASGAWGAIREMTIGRMHG